MSVLQTVYITVLPPSLIVSLFSALLFLLKKFYTYSTKFILCSSSPSEQLPNLQKKTSTPISLNHVQTHHALRGGEIGKVGWLMCVSWTSEINAGWFHQFAPGALVLELVVQIRTTVGAIPGQQLRFTEQTRTRPEDQTNTVLLSCRWCCQGQVSQIIFYVLGGSSLGAEYCLLMWWQKAHNREFTEKLWWRLCLVGLSYPKDHGGMWTIFRLAEISVRSRCQKWWKYWKRRGFRNFFCHLPVDNCFSMDFCQTPKIWACE